MNLTSIRTSILNIASTLIAAAAFSTSAVHAQTPTTRLAVVTVPFAFESGSAHLPAGTYTISLSGTQFISIGGDPKNNAMSMVRWNSDAESSSTTKVVFHRYGNQYFLHEIWDAGAPSHLVAIESKPEAAARKAAKSLTVAGIATVSEQVAVAAR